MEQFVIEIDKLNAIITSIEKEMVSLPCIYGILKGERGVLRMGGDPPNPSPIGFLWFLNKLDVGMIFLVNFQVVFSDSCIVVDSVLSRSYDRNIGSHSLRGIHLTLSCVEKSIATNKL